MKQKNIFLKSKVRSKITFAASPIGFLLAACGGGGGSESSSDDNSSTTTTSTNTSDNYDLNSNNLSSFFADEIDNFTGEYTGSDEVLSPVVDQSQSESYITGYKDKTALVSLTGKMKLMVSCMNTGMTHLKLSSGTVWEATKSYHSVFSTRD